MNCPKCHYPVEEGARFCDVCRTRLDFCASAGPAQSLAAEDSPKKIVQEAVAPITPGIPRRPVPGQDVSDPSAVVAESAKVVRQNPEMWGQGQFDLGVDALVPFIAGSEACNSLRLLFVANDGSIEKVRISVSPRFGVCPDNVSSFAVDPVVREYECLFGVSQQPLGTMPCDVRVEIASRGLLKVYTGNFELVAMTSSDAKESAVRNYYNFEGMKNLAGNIRLDTSKRDPLEKIADMARSGSRLYRRVTMRSAGALKPLPVPRSSHSAPQKEIQLAFGLGYRRHVVQFFTDDEICIGHSVDCVRCSDIVIDEPFGRDGEEAVRYGRISRRHCMLSRKGRDVEICDGVRLNGGCHPSTNGTFLNGGRLEGMVPLVDGEVRLGSANDAVSVKVKAICRSGCDRCPLAADSRITCAGGDCPCVMVTRNDGSDVQYVVLWGCFDLGNVDRNFSGVEIFHLDGAFAWRRGARAGWLESGVDFGLSQYGGIIVSPIWN